MHIMFVFCFKKLIINEIIILKILNSFAIYEIKYSMQIWCQLTKDKFIFVNFLYQAVRNLVLLIL